MRCVPEALKPFTAYNQFIVWREIQRAGKPKPDKVPIHPRTGAPHDPHDPAAWLSATEALQLATAGFNVGFVFTKGDPFFFLDIDNCLQPDGKWSPLAIDLCGQFAGCAMEISHSGKGLHIFGSGEVPAHACKNIPLDLELYTEGRFAALTGAGAVGSAAFRPAAMAQLVATYFPPSEHTAGAEWTDGPCAEWNGPTDDDELIRRMLQSRSSSAVFGNRASVQDLWTGNEDALAAAYPDERGFDHSSADAALCQHLAFWTGKDCERIDRLFRMSALYRDKWETRGDYRHRTIIHAVGYCKAVYGTQWRSDAPQGTTVDASTDTDGYKQGFQFLPVSEQIKHFAGCVYIRDSHRIFTPDGALLKPEQFRVDYGGYLFAMDTINDKSSKNAWEAFTESQAYRFPRAHGICFRPEEAPGELIKEEGRVYLNTYVPIDTPRQKGDAEPFIKHINTLLPEHKDRAILWAYMAACVQYKGVKFQWTPLIQGVEGNGKTLVITALAHAIGNRYTHLPNASDLGGNGHKFNAWIQNKLFIGIEEIQVAERTDILNALKPLITNSRIEIQGKGADQITGDNRANFLLCANPKDAVLVTADSRRYCILYTAQQTKVDKLKCGMGGRYFPDLYKWLRSGGYAIVTDYLYEYPIPDELNPALYCQEAPETSSTHEAIAMSRGGVEQELLEAIDEERPGFAGGWISSMAFDKLLEARRDDKRITRNKRKELLLNLGYIPHPALKDGRVNTPIAHEGGKPRLYIKDGIEARNITQPADVMRRYMEAQPGYVMAATDIFKDKRAGG